MSFWRRLRYGYEQDLDERAHEIERRSYFEALAIGFLLALALPGLLPLLRIPQMSSVISALWPLLPAATILAVVVLAQVLRALHGSVTRRVALMGLGSIALYALVMALASALVSAFIH